MLTTEVGTLVYNHIQHGIYLNIEFCPNFYIPGGDQLSDKVGFTSQYPKKIQSILYRNIFLVSPMGKLVTTTNLTPQKLTLSYPGNIDTMFLLDC